MVVDSRSRKWQITINNPLDKGYTHEKIVFILSDFKSATYCCLSDEIGGDTKTFHTHIFIYFNSAVRFSTLLNKFPGGHFEMCKGTCAENRDYIFKQGKWKNSEKGVTNISDSHFELGEMPIERQGARNDLSDLYDMIRSGMSDYQILLDNPSYMTRLDAIEQCRQILRREEFKSKWRDVHVVYIYGDSGSGKTKYVFDKHGYDNVYRVVDYITPFDDYESQQVLVLDEFRSSLTFSFLLNLLDGYPLQLHCRYRNKMACFNTVYLISNIPLNQQYFNIRQEEPKSWNALLRRINQIMIFENGNIRTDSVRFIQEKLPFKEGN